MTAGIWCQAPNLVPLVATLAAGEDSSHAPLTQPGPPSTLLRSVDTYDVRKLSCEVHKASLIGLELS